MDDAKWERWGALAGVVFIALIVIAALIGGSPPKPADPPNEILKYFKDNQDALRVGSYLLGLAVVPFLWFLGTLFGRLRRAEGGNGRVAGIALTGGVVAIAIATVAGGLGAYAALHPEGSVGIFQISTILFGYVSFAAAIFVAGVSVVAMRTGLLPKWLVWGGEVLALAWLVAGAGVSTEKDAINVVGFIVFLAWAVWIVAVSITLYRTEAATA